MKIATNVEQMTIKMFFSFVTNVEFIVVIFIVVILLLKLSPKKIGFANFVSEIIEDPVETIEGKMQAQILIEERIMCKIQAEELQEVQLEVDNPY